MNAGDIQGMSVRHPWYFSSALWVRAKPALAMRWPDICIAALRTWTNALLHAQDARLNRFFLIQEKLNSDASKPRHCAIWPAN